MLTEGDTIPNNIKGHLISSNKIEDEVSISSLCNNQLLIIFFYPKDMTPGCTIEVQKFRDYYDEIRSLNAEVLGCSKDSENSHCKFINKHKLPYSLISDPEGKILEAFGVWGNKKIYGKTFMGIQRSTFIIKENKVVKVFPKVSVKKHTEEVIDFLKNIA